MRKYKDIVEHEGKLYTKENRVAKVGELVLVTKSNCRHLKTGGIYTVIYEIHNNAGEDWQELSNHVFVRDSDYVVLVSHVLTVNVTCSNTYYDETTQMEQPVPFSKEYYVQADSIDIDINAPEKMTQEEYVKTIDTLQRALRKINTLVDICRSEIEKLQAWMGDKK